MGQETVGGSGEESRGQLRLVPVRARCGEGGAPPAPQRSPSGSTTAQAPAARPPRLLDQVRAAIRLRHYSLPTEEAYVHWIKRFIFFRGKRHPLEMGEKEMSQFLSALATERHVSAATQNQALCALLFTVPTRARPAPRLAR